MIRVISGLYKGKKLKRVPSPLVRPMPDKLKQSLFNILQEEVRDSLFLDGFAGTGSVGIEALSRGARCAVFIDEFYAAVKVLKANLARCEAEDRARVIHREFNRAVIQLGKEEVLFDLIFLDPPYRLLELRNPLKVIHKRKILKPDGKIVLRHYFKMKPDMKYFKLVRAVTIGDDTLSFLAGK
jgi:16S rRNA (guanine966-N2)-methyltransferase